MADLILEGVSCAYAAEPVLEGVSLRIGPGDFVGILGPNGSGKSTLIRTAGRVLHPRLGRVLLDAADLYTLSPRGSAQFIGVVPQETTIDFDFTCYEVVLMGRSPHLGRFEEERPEDHRIVREAMERTRSWDLRDRLFGRLSGGERQRVIVARAFAQTPKVLLLDEPTSHLDVRYQLEILELVRALCREKSVAVLAALHDLNLAAHFCDRLVLLDRGRMAAMGRWDEVLTPERVREVFGVEAEVRDRRIAIKFPP